MADFERPEPNVRASGVYPGAILGASSYPSQIKPIFALAVIHPGFWVMDGSEWTVDPATITYDHAAAYEAFSVARARTNGDKFAVAALVAVTHAALPGDSFGDSAVVLDVAVHPVLAGNGRRDFWGRGRAGLIDTVLGVVRGHFGYDPPAAVPTADDEDDPDPTDVIPPPTAN